METLSNQKPSSGGIRLTLGKFSYNTPDKDLSVRSNAKNQNNQSDTES
jgi:hypothetical protein